MDRKEEQKTIWPDLNEFLDQMIDKQLLENERILMEKGKKKWSPLSINYTCKDQ